MILTGSEIKKRIKNGDIEITPYDEKLVNPNSYNLRLYNKLKIYTDNILDMKKSYDGESATQEIEIPEEGYCLKPGELYLARTYEHTVTKTLVPMILGRSSVARLGIFIHITGGFGDIGFSGYWTLELTCIRPVIIYPMAKICQIFYNTVEGDKDKIYDKGKYQNNNGIQSSRLYLDFENQERK